MGFDAKSRKFVNEIPEANFVTREGPSSLCVLPYDKSGRLYTMSVLGNSSSSTDTADLIMTGPGFVVGFKGLSVRLGTNYLMSAASDGHMLSFTANAGGRTPDLLLTTQSGRGKPSYRFEFSSLNLASGKSVTVKIDVDLGKLYFRDDDPAKNPYELRVRRTNPDGTRAVYVRHGISFGEIDNYEMDLSKWDGKGPMCFYVAGDQSSSEKKPCVSLANQSEQP